MEQTASKLPPLQLELLRIYSFNPSEEELIEVKNMLARFFAKRFSDQVAKAAQVRNITDETLDQWLEEDEQ